MFYPFVVYPILLGDQSLSDPDKYIMKKTKSMTEDTLKNDGVKKYNFHARVSNFFTCYKLYHLNYYEI